jgi:hypothetical protein
MKFKRLALDDFKTLEPEFINFLATNQITAQDWINIKNSQHTKMNELLDGFSDLVYEKVLQKINFLEHRTEKELKIFHFEKEQVTLLSMQLDALSELDFTKHNFVDLFKDSNLDKISVFSSSKNYQNERNLEVFQLLESGCSITDEKLFNAIMNTKK